MMKIAAGRTTKRSARKAVARMMILGLWKRQRGRISTGTTGRRTGWTCNFRRHGLGNK